MSSAGAARVGVTGVDKAPDAFRTISEVADDLDLPQHVLRFWETRFAQIKPMKRGGGRRYYRPEDVDVLRGIRHLLYSEGYTIRGVQRIFKDHGVRFVQSVWQAGAPQPAKAPSDVEEPEAQTAGQESDEPRRRLFGILPPLSEGEEPEAARTAERSARSPENGSEQVARGARAGAPPSSHRPAAQAGRPEIAARRRPCARGPAQAADDARRADRVSPPDRRRPAGRGFS